MLQCCIGHALSEQHKQLQLLVTFRQGTVWLAMYPGHSICLFVPGTDADLLVAVNYTIASLFCYNALNKRDHLDLLAAGCC